ncbi:hypothetical protein ACHAPU_010173 [Fusarium lateritium]
MQQPTPKRRGPLSPSKVLQFFVAIFVISNFITAVLNGLAAGEYSEAISKWSSDPEIRGHPANRDKDGHVLQNPLRYLRSSPVPFAFLGAISGIAWIIATLTLLSLLTKARQFNHRVARYVFKIIAVIAFIFLIVFYFGWTTSLTFEFPFAAEWGIGRAAVIFAHINLLFAIFITLLSAVLDTPKDIPPEPPTGPNTRRPTQA